MNQPRLRLVERGVPDDVHADCRTERAYLIDALAQARRDLDAARAALQIAATVGGGVVLLGLLRVLLG